MAEAAVPDELVERLDLDLLPGDWRILNNTRCRDLGSAWVQSGRSVTLMVPSVVVEGDWNVLLNPRHAEFARIKILPAKPFRYDERMFR